tara:strand:+ start:162 stop:443 length:282 start_codon:yes stop_codon:yes gene_type:complete
MTQTFDEWKKETYNGWTNRETWNTSLWIGNVEPLYNLILGIVEESKNLGDCADRLEQFLWIIWDGKTPDDCSLKPVNFVEIAESWWEEFRNDD